MATKIITNQTEWKPVKIEMEFTTRQQLAMFVEMMGSAHSIAEVIKENSDITCDVTECMELFEMEHAIDQMINVNTWNQLKSIANS